MTNSVAYRGSIHICFHNSCEFILNPSECMFFLLMSGYVLIHLGNV